ncbi:cyclic AMP-dependent transcription factor ATF-1-like isoform X2 [Tachypleus tridentatus]|uniref:cyclic AMP-dependent transcription factor ATF-1-like isoform X2 n=1 Tax=Tachypleus tridentatus TaxID=6853 RepID=UPI003FD3FE8F
MESIDEEQNGSVDTSKTVVEQATYVSEGSGRLRHSGVVSPNGGGATALANSLTAAVAQVRSNGTVVLVPFDPEKHGFINNIFSVKHLSQVVAPAVSTQALTVPQPGGAVSFVHVSIPSNTQVVQSVIQQNQQSVIQSPGSTTLQSLGKHVFFVNKDSVIHSTEGDSGVHPVQILTSSKSFGDSESGFVAVATQGEELKKRQENLTRQPSYHKILKELSLTEPQVAMPALEGEINLSKREENKSEEEISQRSTSNSSHLGQSLTVAGTQYQGTAGLLKAIQMTASSQDDGIQGIQTLSMASTGSGSTGTILQYTQGPDGQFYVPVSVSGVDLQTYQIRAAPSSPTSGLSQGVVMATASSVKSQEQHAEELSRKRELRLLKNREAAKECRRKKKEYIKCLENRVAVLENQNKALIEELKSLKELYCQKTD